MISEGLRPQNITLPPTNKDWPPAGGTPPWTTSGQAVSFRLPAREFPDYSSGRFPLGPPSPHRHKPPHPPPKSPTPQASLAAV